MGALPIGRETKGKSKNSGEPGVLGMNMACKSNKCKEMVVPD